MELGIILTPSARSKAYIQKILKNKFSLSEIIFLNDGKIEPDFEQEEIFESNRNGFDISESVLSTLEKNNLSFKEFDFIDINNQELVNFIAKSNSDFFIFSGGGILKDSILNTDKKFIHFHPGIVPQYRGSTCFYYSILKENNCGVTSFLMDKNLDTGDIIYQKKFKKPSHEFIDDVYDAHIRSETMLDVLNKKLLNKKKFKKQSKEGNTYYIIHPILKHIAILSCIKNLKNKSN